jgi:hypothetical protein
MDAAFYNHDTSPQGLRRAILPASRLLRRVQRPYFQRLRDLLAMLWQQNRDRQCEIHELREKLATAERTIIDLHTSLRGFQVDYTAVTRRMAHLEDLLLDTLKVDEDASPDVLPLRAAA